MKHYRIIKHSQICYSIERRFLWFFWEQISLNAIESAEEAEDMLYSITNKQKPEIVKELTL